MPKKTKFRKTLERILTAGLTGCVVLVGGWIGSVNGAEIVAKNSTSAPGFGKGIMYIQTREDANEGSDIYDGGFPIYSS